MVTPMYTNHNTINSFTCRCIIRDNDIYLLEPAPQLCQFFGTTPADYENGIINRIRKDIDKNRADILLSLCRKKSVAGEDFRVTYPSLRYKQPCHIQIDCYAGEPSHGGRLYELIGMDITELVETRKKAEYLMTENLALTEDSPVGLGIYHIEGNNFDLIYTNAEYYKVHHGSREYWDSFKGQDAMNRILPEDRPMILKEWQRVRTDPTNPIYSAKYRCYGEDGNIHWIHLLARLTPEVNGKRICYASYINVDNEKEAEERAAEAQRNLINTITGLPTASALYSLDPITGELTPESFTDGFCKMRDATQQEAWELYGHDAYGGVHPDDAEKLKAYFKQHFQDTKISHIRYRVRTPKGTYKWLGVNFKIFNASNLNYVFVDYTDISNIKAHEDALEQQYRNAQADLDSLSDRYIATLRLNITQNDIETLHGINPLMTKNAITSYDNLLQAMIKSMPRSQDRIEFLHMYNRDALLHTYQTGTRTIPMEYCFKDTSGSTRWARSGMRLMRRPGGSDIIAFATLSDITHSKTMEILMNDILIKEYDFISIIDITNNSIDLLSINQQSALVAEVHSTPDYDSLMRDYIEQHVIEEDKQACIDFMTLSNVERGLAQQPKVTAAFKVNEDGKLRNKQLDYYYLDREARLLAFVRTDFTELQEEQLRQEEKLRLALDAAEQASIAKSQFLSRMSHEIRTPMNAIIGLDTIALQEMNMSVTMRDHLNKIGISARFLLSLINDILDMSRIESGRMLLRNEEFNFRRLIDSINTILMAQCQEKGIQYDCSIKGYAEEFYIGDETKLQQILINILGNAVKFTSPGGKIHFVIEQVTQHNNNAHMKFTIADTGIGIDEDFIPHLFESFSQENDANTSTYGGTGLGLAISKSLVHLMDGNITVHSVKGIGTDFTIDVTLAVSADRNNTYHSTTLADLGTLKTLIVDDEIIDCQHTELVLKQAGIEADWVDSGAEAVIKVREHHETTDDYKLIIIDWKMPEMDGLETTKQIRQIVGPEVTIIILTAYDWSEIEQKAKNAGVNYFLRKPIFVSSVIQAYDEALMHNCNTQVTRKRNYDFSGKRLLLAEDNEINAEIAKELLEIKGFTITIAENGVEAIKAFTESKVGEYSAILMDIRMPFMDGLEATRTIRAIHKEDSKTIPIIAMSANAFEEDIQKSLDSGMNAHLSKPLDTELMYATLDKFIHRR